MINKKNYILDIKDEKKYLPKAIKEYVTSNEIKILKEKKPIYLFDRIKKNENNWYLINTKEYSDIIFNYIVRNNKRFILNNKSLIRDNFYEITLKEKNDLYLLLAILNSSITSYLLETIGRRQGKGLLKIQKYELDDLSIINPNILSDNDKKELSVLGKMLSNVLNKNSNEIIENIDRILIKYSCNIDINEFKRRLINKEKARVEG